MIVFIYLLSAPSYHVKIELLKPLLTYLTS